MRRLKTLGWDRYQKKHPAAPTLDEIGELRDVAVGLGKLNMLPAHVPWNIHVDGSYQRKGEWGMFRWSEFFFSFFLVYFPSFYTPMFSPCSFGFFCVHVSFSFLVFTVILCLFLKFAFHFICVFHSYPGIGMEGWILFLLHIYKVTYYRF